jgi:ryanodine receptor 2
MAAAEKLAQSKTAKTEPSPFAAIDFGAYAKRIVSFLARNFFTMKFIALAIAFSINFMLLFYKVCKLQAIVVILASSLVTRNY